MPTTIGQHTVATFTSPVNGTTPIDANTVRGNDNTIRTAYNNHDTDTGIHVQSSTLASRPAAGTAGRKWITADAGSYKLWYDDGTRWNEVGNDAVDVSFIASANIVKGDVLKLTGWNNGLNLPELAPATGAGDICFAIATEAVTNGSRSFAVNTGFIEDVNTSAFSVGDVLYPSNGAGPGSITSWFQNTKPTSGNYQVAAYVIRDNSSNGVLFVEFSAPRIVERSDNTASTVVLRDGSGNFAAGAITAGSLNAAGLVEFDSLKGTGATTVTNILDEDNMASNSDTALATQQSIKAYVDAQVTAQDLDFAADSGTGSVDLDSQSLTIAGTANEITTSASGQTVTVGLPSSITVDVVGSLTGNADTATKLSSTRTFAVTGDVTGTVSSDLTSGASIATSIAAGVIVDADISGSAAIGLSKLATGALPTGITIASANIVDGTIVNADISNSAEIAVSKLADGSARQLLQTDAAGTGVEWTSNVDVPGTLDVTGATTLDSTLTVTGDANFDSGTLFVDVSDNRVGLGTTAPDSRLTILAPQYDVDAFGGMIRWQHPTSTADSVVQGYYVSGQGSEVLMASNAYQSTGSGIIRFNTSEASAVVYADRGGNTLFLNGGVSANPTERMRIDSSGNVGIGSTSPKERLEIAGLGGNIRLFGRSGVAANQLNSNVYYNGSAWVHDDTGKGACSIILDTNSDDAIKFYTTASTTGYPDERMRITSSGNVGIGTSSPATDTLHVAPANDTAFSGVRVQRSGTSGQHATLNYYGGAARLIATDTVGSNPVILFKNSTNGTSATERMRIDSSGRVGIGTTSPSTKLHLQDNSPVYIQITDAGDGAGRVGQNGTALTFGVDLADGSTERMRITSGGEVYIAGTTDQGAYNLQCNGTGVWGQGAYVNGSDQRMKQNISELHDGLDIVMQLRPVTYQYKPEFSKDQSTQPGFIAQELQQALEGKPYRDGVVPEGPQYLNVAYQNLIPILVKAIQQLEAKVAQLENA